LITFVFVTNMDYLFIVYLTSIKVTVSQDYELQFSARFELYSIV